MNNTKARELMIPLESFPHVHAADSVLNAISVLCSSHLEVDGEMSLPRLVLVFDDDDCLIGMVRRRDLMRAVSPRFFFRSTTTVPEGDIEIGPDTHLSEIMSSRTNQKILKRATQRVGEIAEPVPDGIPANANLVVIVREMVDQDFHMLPVLQDDHVIGVVRSVEVLKALERLIGSVATDE